MELRHMLAADYGAVYQLWLSCAGMGLNDLDDSQEGIESFLRRNPSTCFVAVRQDRIVGTILAGNDGRRGYIYHTAVHPAYRGQGIGRALVRQVLDALSACGIHKAALVVFARNQPGNLFWEKLGFTVREDIIYRDLALTEMVRIDT